MSTLYLIRHGQASFGAPDYDVLSERGARQARHLGAYFADRARHLDAVYTGPRRRHMGTTQQFLAGARVSGATYPEPVQVDDLDEYPAFELLAHWMPTLIAEDPVFADLMRAGGERGPHFDRAFDRLLVQWARGELDTGDVESFAHFRARVRTGLRHIMDTEGRRRHIAVITSGGPICIAVQMALDLAADIAIRQGLVVVNGSYSEFRYRDSDAITLASFNITGHLPDDLVTYR